MPTLNNLVSIPASYLDAFNGRIGVEDPCRRLWIGRRKPEPVKEGRDRGGCGPVAADVESEAHHGIIGPHVDLDREAATLDTAPLGVRKIYLGEYVADTCDDLAPGAERTRDKIIRYVGDVAYALR